jgi:hypothetical protein
MKHTLLIIGLVGLLIYIAVTTLHNPDTCRAMVLKDLSKHTAFQTQIKQYTVPTDFLTELTKKGN